MSVNPGQGFTPVQANPLRTAGPVGYHFSFLDLAASQTALQATRSVAGALVTLGVRAPYNGSVIAISVESVSTNAGVATFVPYVNAIAQVPSFIWSSATTGDYQTFTPGDASFVAGDLLDVRATTDSAFTGTPDVDVTLFVSFAV